MTPPTTLLSNPTAPPTRMPPSVTDAHQSTVPLSTTCHQQRLQLLTTVSKIIHRFLACQVCNLRHIHQFQIGLRLIGPTINVGCLTGQAMNTVGPTGPVINTASGLAFQGGRLCLPSHQYLRSCWPNTFSQIHQLHKPMRGPLKLPPVVRRIAQRLQASSASSQAPKAPLAPTTVVSVVNAVSPVGPATSVGCIAGPAINTVGFAVPAIIVAGPAGLVINAAGLVRPSYQHLRPCWPIACPQLRQLNKPMRGPLKLP